MRAPKLEVQSGITVAALVDFHDINRIQRTAFPTPWSKELIRAAIVNEKYEVRVLRFEALPVVGFYISHGTRGKSNLDNVAVETHLRGQGLGSQLIRHWIERARQAGLTALSLQVNTANARAQELYKSFDFRAVRLLAAYYPNGDDAYQMEMALSSLPAPHGTPRRR